MIDPRLAVKHLHGCAGCPLSRIEAGELLCEKAGRVRPFDPSFCPEDRWGKVFLAQGTGATQPKPMADPAKQAAREKAKGIWGLAEKAILAGRVLTSGRASDEDIATRKVSCSACPARKQNARGERYCGECGCGQWFGSRLDNKITFKDLPCPRGAPGFFGSPDTSDPSSKVSFGGSP